MSPQVYFENNFLSNVECENVASLRSKISQYFHIPAEDLFVVINGRPVNDDLELKNVESVIRVFTRLVGGKGGFGSMLRAIGAQIQKTTNREACRDLSGRRLRDINEEKRLRKWLDGKEDREKDAAEKKQKKLEKLIAEPKIEVNLNASYEKEREELPTRVSAAVDAGWQAAGSSNESSKRKAEETMSFTKKKKFWIDAELSDCSISDSDDDEQDSNNSPRQIVSTDSSNESDRVQASET